MLKSGIKAVATVLLLFLVVAIPMDLWGAWRHPGAYPFSSEGPAAGRWMYASQTNYLVTGAVAIGSALLGLGALWAGRLPRIARLLLAAPLAFIAACSLAEAFR